MRCCPERTKKGWVKIPCQVNDTICRRMKKHPKTSRSTSIYPASFGHEKQYYVFYCFLPLTCHSFAHDVLGAADDTDRRQPFRLATAMTRQRRHLVDAIEALVVASHLRRTGQMDGTQRYQQTQTHKHPNETRNKGTRTRRKTQVKAMLRWCLCEQLASSACSFYFLISQH